MGFFKKSDRPRIKPELSAPDKAMEMAGFGALAYFWVLVLMNYNSLPDTIPVHFNFSGEPDRYGSKATLLILPCLSTVIYIILSVLNKYPHTFNYAVKITEENALRQYTNATKMLRYLKFAMILLFTVIFIQVLDSVYGGTGEIGYWFMPVSIALIFFPMIYFIAKMFKDR